MTPDSKPKTARWDYIKLKASVQQSSEWRSICGVQIIFKLWIWQEENNQDS
jgi:hypothetical protein